ncbi:hypothetical protein ACJVC5_17360 [Peredibacter sp. HCB2-198]|uniref:hypothetical protein n=1 Tax=Peredibacter sp. HCB2-198 TaxID=3383025 RepID=UPI0038B438F4
MKFLFVVLTTALSLSAMAGTKTTVELASENNRVAFKAAESTRVLHIAGNPTCVEMEPTHFFPLPSLKEKISAVEVTDSKITFDKKLGGLCNYKFANVYLRLNFDNKETVGLTLFADNGAPAEIDLICSKGKYGMECREKGEAESSKSVRLYVDLNKATKINVFFE